MAIQPAAAATACGPSCEIVTHELTGFGVIALPGTGGLLLNAQGRLWRLPAQGGEALAISSDMIEPTRMALSPDGARLVLQSYRDGMFHLWSLRPDGTGLTQLTQGDFDDLDPAFSPDGKQLAFVSDRGGNRDLWRLDLASGKATRIDLGEIGQAEADTSAMASLGGRPSWVSEPRWSPDGSQIAFIRDRKLFVLDLASGKVRLIRAAQGWKIAAPNWSRDGRRISYVEDGALWQMPADASNPPARIGDKDDVFTFPATPLEGDGWLYSANGGIWITQAGATRPVPFTARLPLDRPIYTRKAYDFDDARPQPVKGIVSPHLSPDGKQVVFKALNDLWLLPTDGTGKARRLTRDSFYKTDPAFSPDGRAIAYASDEAGTQDLYSLDLATGARRRLTHEEGAEISPAWSPDGKTIAFATQTGEIRLLALASGGITTLARGLNQPGRLSWSPDGRQLTLSALKEALNQILTIDVADGAQHYRPALPGRTLGPRGEEGPVWSGDGRNLLFEMESLLYTQPAAGGPLHPLTTEASDAPSWSADGQQVLYLHNGALRLLDRRSGKIRTLETGLTWTQAIPHQRLLIRGGALWDGVHEAVRRDVDLLIVDNRIARIEPTGMLTAGPDTQLIDAQGMTLVPGLFDMHNHQQMRSRFLGDRQGRAWLAYGVTATRSTGDQAYRALEDKEALASGARIGPRYFMTGEMFEGRRVEWEFARPVADESQLRRDLSRARDLGFDVIKTYVRFPFDMQARVIAAAHDMGISVTSHYLYPGVGHGVDGEEHLGGPTRWAYSEVSGGHCLYDDVFQTLTRSHLQITTTNFSSAAELAADPALVADARIAALYPPWERKDLQDKLACAQGNRALCGFLPPDPAQSRAAVEQFTRLLHGGAMVMAGTDSPLDSYGLSLQLNLRSMAHYGMTPFENLQIATIIPARAQGVGKDLGSIEPGKLADIVFVRGDPAHRIEDLVQVEQVMKGGTLITRAQLLAPFAGKP